MAEIKHLVITVSREYGAGGRSLSKGLAEKLGIEWYDYDFIMKAAAMSGIPYEELTEEDEALSRTDIIIENLFGDNLLYSSTREKIFEAEKHAMINLAQKPCIIVGRCSNAILKAAYIPVFRIFLYADLGTKIKRAEELKEYREGTDPAKYVQHRDALRRNYYRRHTGCEFNDPHEYDICLDTSRLGIEDSVNMLYDMILKKDQALNK